MINSETETTSSINEPRFIDRFSIFKSTKGLIVFILIVLILASIVSYSSQNNKDNNSTGIKPTPTISRINSQHILIYGAWLDNKSVIKGVDTKTKKEYLLAELPFNIKKISILSKDRIIYIGDTDDKDHGENLSIYNISTKTSKIVYKSDAGFGIDDYVISKNGDYVSTWEVSFKESSSVLLGGRSRAYAISLSNPDVKNLIYDEIANKPVHYPRGIKSDGTIFFDTFLPNSSAGWAHGMSVSDFKGTNKRDLENMKNGTYGNQPSISPDENYFVFSGYDKTDGADDENGFRKALLHLNTVELLDTNTFERRKLPNLSDKDLYLSSYFDRQNGAIILSVKTNNDTDYYSYSLTTGAAKKIPIKNSLISYLSATEVLTGDRSQTTSAIGNLGNSYGFAYNTLSVYNVQTEQIIPIKLSDNFIQYISVTPANYFTNITEIDTDINNRLQLQTFSLKPTLATKRERQQTAPPAPTDFFRRDDPNKPLCWQLVMERCGCNINSEDSTDPGCSECANKVLEHGNICYDSPLYVYGKNGTNINVKVKTYTYLENPAYDQNTGYNIQVIENGKMKVNGNIYDRINYNYLSKKVSPPNYGTVTTRKELKQTLIDYAGNLGLNKKETEDLITNATNIIKSPFVLVSFYDQKTSEQILPLEFNPQPDTYINIVFYFKEYTDLPPLSLISPTFPNIPNRSGLTVVEISEIIEK